MGGLNNYESYNGYNNNGFSPVPPVEGSGSRNLLRRNL